MRTVKHLHNRENLGAYLQGMIDGIYTARQVSDFTGYTVPHLYVLKKTI